MVSWLIAPSFSLANSLILDDVLTAACKYLKHTFSKVSFNISCQKIDLKLKTFFCEKNLEIVKNEK